MAQQALAGPCDPPANAIVCENSKAGQPAQRMGRGRAPATRASRASRPTSASTTARRSTSRSRPTRPSTTSTSTGWATTAATAPARSQRSTPSATLPQNQPPCDSERDDRAWSTAATGRSPRPGRCRPTLSRASTSPSWSATTRRRTASHIVFVVRDDGGHSDLLFQTSDTTWQAYNRLRRQQPLRGRRRGSTRVAPTR